MTEFETTSGNRKTMSFKGFELSTEKQVWCLWHPYDEWKTCTPTIEVLFGEDVTVNKNKVADKLFLRINKALKSNAVDYYFSDSYVETESLELDDACVAQLQQAFDDAVKAFNAAQSDASGVLPSDASVAGDSGDIQGFSESLQSQPLEPLQPPQTPDFEVCRTRPVTNRVWSDWKPASELADDFSFKAGQRYAVQLKFDVPKYAAAHFDFGLAAASGRKGKLGRFAGFVLDPDVGQCGTLGVANSTYTLNQSVSADATCFNVTAANVTLDCQGWTINYSGVSVGYGVYTNSTNTTIKNCAIQETINSSVTSARGIYFNGAPSGNGTIYNNTITTILTSTTYLATNYGIYLSSSSSNNISNNNITTSSVGSNTGRSYGIYLSSSSSNNLSSNNITASSDIGYGIYLSSSSSNNLSSSTINAHGSAAFGVYLESSSSTNSFSNNYVITSHTYSGDNGFYLYSSSNNLLISNNISASGSATYGGQNVRSGICVASSNNTIISSNNVTTNTMDSYGFYSDTSINSTLTNNSFNTIGSSAYGFYSSTSTNSALTGNKFNTTSSIGIYVTGTTSAHYNQSIDTSNSAEGYPIAYNYSLSNTNVFVNQNLTNSYGQLICAWCTNVSYQNVTIANDGFSFYNTSNSTINNSVVSTSKGYGVFVYGPSASYLQNNSFNLMNITTSTNSYLYGVYLLTASGNNVTNTNVTTSGGIYNYGVYLSSSSRNNLTNNYIATNGNTANAFYLTSSSNNNLTNNIVQVGIAGTSTIGIKLEASSNNTLDRNNVTNAGTYTDAINLVSTSNGNNLTNNNATDTNTYGSGIDFSASSNNNLLNNKITSKGSAGYCGISFSSTATNNSINDTTINATGTSDILSVGSGINNFTNCTFNKSDTSVTSTGSINVFWYLDAYVNNSLGQPVTGANVSGYAVNGLNVFNSTTYFGELPSNQGTTDYANMAGNVLLYHLNETSGTITDYSGGGRNGAASNVAYGASGILNGTALSFNGVNSSVSFTQINTSALSGWSAFAWGKYYSNGATYSAVFGGYALQIYNPDGRLAYWNGTGSYFNSNNGISQGSWAHVGIVCDKPTETLKFYINGVLNGTRTNANCEYSNSNRIKYLGTLDGSYLFNGTIDEPVVWNRTLSDSEVYKLYRAGAGYYQGFITRQTLREYMQNATGTYYDSNYTLNATHSYWGNASIQVNLTDNKIVDLNTHAVMTVINNVTTCLNISTANSYWLLTQNVTSPSTCFNITASNVTLDCQGYAINYSSASWGIGVYSNSTNTTVKNCVVKSTIMNSAFGIYFNGASASNGTIYNNSITTIQTGGYGIYLSLSSNNNVTKNNVKTTVNYDHGIRLDSSSNNYLVSNNVTTDSTYTHGIYFTSNSNNNTIIGNNVTGAEIYLSSSSNNNLTNNNIITSTTGFYLLTNANNNSITSNNVTSTGSYGFYSDSSTNSTLTGNRFNTSSAVGVYITGTTAAHYNHSIDASNLAEGLPIAYNYSLSNTNVFTNVNLTNVYGQLICAWCSNVTYQNVTMSNDGFSLYGSNSSTISYSNVSTSKGYPILINGGYFNNVSYGNYTTTGTGVLTAIMMTSTSNNTVANDFVATSGASVPGVSLSSANYNNVTNTNVITTGASAGGVSLSAATYNFINNASIRSGGTGLYLSDTAYLNNFSSISVYTTAYYAHGIHVMGYNNIFTNVSAYVTFDYSTRALMFYGSSAYGNQFFNSNFTSLGDSSDIMFRDTYSTTPNNFTNCSYNKSRVNTWGSVESQREQFWWYADVHTTTSGGADLGSVTINESNVNGTSIFNGTTNSTGWLARQTIMEYMQNATGKYNATPHWFNASKDGYYANNTVQNITRSITATIALTYINIAPNVSLTAPLNASWSTTRNTNFTFTPTDDQGFKNCTTLLWYGNGTALNSTNWNSTAGGGISNNTVNGINYTFAVDGTYLWNVLCFDNGTPILSNQGAVNRTVFVDATPPTATLVSPENDEYHASPINFTASVSDGFGLKNATLTVWNETGVLNQTTTSFGAVGVLTATVYALVDLGTGVYNWSCLVFDYAGNSVSSQVFAVTTDEPRPLNMRLETVGVSNATFSWENKPNSAWISLRVGNNLVDIRQTYATYDNWTVNIYPDQEYAFSWQAGDNITAQGGEHGFSFRTLSWNPALANYLHRRLITVNHSLVGLVGADKENYGLNLSLTDENFVYAGLWGAVYPSFALLNYSNHNDIRFTDYADVAVLPFNVSFWSVPGEGGQSVQGPPDEHAVTGNISDASNMWDADWSSFSVPNPSGTYFFNYSIPVGAKNSSEFRLYDGDWNWYDLPVPASCFQGVGGKIRFKSVIDYNGPSITTYCWNYSSGNWNFMQVTASQYFYETQMTWVYAASANIIVMPTHFNDLTQNQSYGVDGDYDTKLWMYYGNANDVSNESVLSYSGLVDSSFSLLGEQVDKPVGAPVISGVNDSVGRTATGTNISWTVDQSVDNRVLLALNPWFMNAFWATTLTNVTESFNHLYAKANQTVLLVVHPQDFLGLVSVSCSNSSYNANYSLNALASPVEITFLNVNSSEYLNWNVSYSENKSWARNTKHPAFQILNLTPNSLYYYKLYSYGATANSTFVGNFTLGSPASTPSLRFVNYSADRPNDAATVCANVTNLNGNPSVQASFQYWNNESDSGFNETSPVTVNSVEVYCQIVSGLTFGHVYYFRGKAVGGTTGYSDASSHDFFAVQEFFAGDASNRESVERDIEYCPPNPDGTANINATCFTERGYLPGTLRETDFIYIESNVSVAVPLTVSWFDGSSWSDHAMAASAFGFQYLTLTNLDVGGSNAWQTFYVKNSSGSVVLNWTKPSAIHLNGESRRDESAFVAFGGTPTAIDYAVFYPRIPYYNSTSYEWCQAAPGGDLYKCMGVQFWGGGGLGPELAGTAFDRAQLERGQVLDGEPWDTAYLEPTLDSSRPTSMGNSSSQQRYCFAFLALWWNTPFVSSSNITNYYVHYWQQDEWWSSYLGRAQDRLFDQSYLFYWEYDANQYVRNWKPFDNTTLLSQNVVKRVSNDTFNAPYNESLVADFKGGFNVDATGGGGDALYNLGFYIHGRWPNFQVGKHQQMFLIFNLPASLTACENTTATLNCTVAAGGCDEVTDSDSDNLTDCKELWVYHLNPKMNDTNEVGRSDGWLVAHGYDVNDPTQFNTPPTVSSWAITGPDNFSGNASSNDVELNPGVPYVFSVNASDADGDAFSYEWSFDGAFVSAGVNASITVPDSGAHNVTLNLTDSFNESSLLFFRVSSVDSIPPVPALGTNPVDGFVSSSHDVVFDFSCTDNFNVSTIQLWGNFNGSWAVNYSDSGYLNGSVSSVGVNGIPEGSFVWGVYCNDSVGNAAWSVNRSLTVLIPTPPSGGGGGSAPSCGPCVADGVCQSCCGSSDSDCVASSPYPSLAFTPFPTPTLRVTLTPKPTVEPSPSIEPSDSIWTQFPATKEGASQAINSIQELIRIAETQNKDVNEARRLLEEARQAADAGDYAAAEDYMRQADAALKKAGVVKNKGFIAGFDWFTSLLTACTIFLVAGGAYWLYYRKNKR